MVPPKTIVQPTFSETNTIRDVKYTISSLPHIRSKVGMERITKPQERLSGSLHRFLTSYGNG